MKTRLLVGIVLLLALETAAMAADPFVGTWKWNQAKSQFPAGTSPMYKSMTLIVEGQANGLKIIEDGVTVDGKPLHIEGIAKYDRKDYPITGSPFFDTRALVKVDAKTIDLIMKKGGQEVRRQRGVISSDGKTLTFTSTLPGANGSNRSLILVCEKQ